jgi:hypothetical protein
MPFAYASLQDRIIANTVLVWGLCDDGTPCWIWIGKKNSAGYGQLTYRPRSKKHRHKVKTALAHKAAYFAFKGIWIKRRVLLHKCDIRLCCNPAHLSPGTHKKNTQDMLRKGRGKGMPVTRWTYNDAVKQMEHRK